MARRSDLEEAAIDWVKGNCDPDDVFGDAALGIWAEENGYIKAEEQK